MTDLKLSPGDRAVMQAALRYYLNYLDDYAGTLDGDPHQVEELASVDDECKRVGGLLRLLSGDYA